MWDTEINTLNLDGKQLNLIFQNIQFGLLLEDSNRKILLVNESFLRIFGIPMDPNQMIGMDCSESATTSSVLFVQEQAFIDRIHELLELKQKSEDKELEMKDGRVLSRVYIPIWKNDVYDGHLWVYDDVTEKIAASKQFQNQKHFYEDILNKIPADIAVFDKSHNYLFVNPKGVADSEMRQWIIGKSDLDYCKKRNISEAIAFKRNAYFSKALGQRSAYSWEEVIRNRRGVEEVHMRIFSPNFNEKGELETMIGYGMNITESRKHELALAEANRNLILLTNLLDNSSDAIQVSTEDGAIFYMNDEACGRLGIDKSEIRQFKVSDFEEIFKQPGAWEKHVEELKQKGSLLIDGINVNLQNGQKFPVEVSVKYIEIEDTGYVIANSRDVTERNRVLTQIKTKQSMLNAVAKATDELLSNPDLYDACSKSLCIIGESVGVDRVYLFENSKVDEELLTSQRIEWNSVGIAPQINNPELQNVPLSLFGDLGEILKNKQPFIALVDAIENMALKEILASQQIISILIFPIVHDGQLWGFVGYDDCTNAREWSQDEVALLQSFSSSISNAIERNALEKSALKARDIAESATRAKSEFLANMSHEIRTPMNAFIGITNLLAKTNLDPTQRRYIKLINESSENLISIVNDVLDLERYNAGKIELEKTSFDLKERINKSIELFMNRSDEKGLKLKFIPELPDGLSVEGDPNRLSQLLNNLIGNAIKFTSKGKVEVKVKIESFHDSKVLVRFDIIDTGIGIENDRLKKIFNPYEQGGNDISKQFGGTGLGLSICKQIVELCDGQIEVDSIFGEGSRFTVLLPFDEVRSGSNAIENEFDDVLSIGLEGKKVLVAEDVEVNRFLVQSILESWGCEVDLASDGLQAIEKIKQRHYDVVIMDILMPVMDGKEALQTIRQNLESDMPVIALTANVFNNDRKMFLDLGFNDCLSKPFTERELFKSITGLLSSESIKTIKPSVVKIKPYSLSFIESISNGKSDFIKKMIELFIQNSAHILEELKNAFELENLKEIKKGLHKLKPSLYNFMIEEAKPICADLYRLADEQKLDPYFKVKLDKLFELVNATRMDMQKSYFN